MSYDSGLTPMILGLAYFSPASIVVSWMPCLIRSFRGLGVFAYTGPQCYLHGIILG